MKLNRKIYTTELDNAPVTIEVSEIAHQANAAVIARHGDTAVLATVVMGKNDRDTDYFPLTVDYEERFYAVGKIMGSRFVRREGKASDEATLSARLIDRTIRPLFDDRLRRDMQVVITILAYDEVHDPDALALLAVSTALSISDIPWNGPVAGVAYSALRTGGTLHYKAFFAGPESCVNMIELEGAEIEEQKAAELFTQAHQEIVSLIAFQKTIIKEIGKVKANVPLTTPDPRLEKIVKDFIAPELARAITEKGGIYALRDSLMAHLTSTGENEATLIAAMFVFERTVDAYVHDEAIHRGKRCDGRAFDEVRDLYSEVGLFNRMHGSGMFMRGDTQVLAVTTLASPAAEQLVETMEMSGKRRFMLHYNFPGFATGETGKGNKGPGRREIGHGALAAKALVNMIPSKDVFPYTIRIVAETLSSNGSSSMASTCAASLSLMDAGVPMPKHVAGIAMGLMSNEKGEYKVLTDIQGPEDHYGDMDLKIAGTRDGVTAIQMDVKVNGISRKIFEEALASAKKARLHILSVMETALPAPRAQVSTFAPTIRTLFINPDKIGVVIGPGGKMINGIIASMDNKVAIDIEQEGKIYVSGVDAALVQKTMTIIEQLVKEYKVGDIIEGEVIKILDFGAIVDLGGDRDGMIHVSELKEGFVKNVEEVVKLHDHVRARVVRADPDGRIGLTLKNISQE